MQTEVSRGGLQKVTLTLDPDEFVALVVLWSIKFDGHDGNGGLRDKVDSGMKNAWKTAFPEERELPDVGGRFSVVAEAQRVIDKLQQKDAF